MTIEEMKDKKRELGFSCEELAERSGIPCSTIQKIFGGTTRSPRRTTVEALERALQAADQAADRVTEKPGEMAYRDLLQDPPAAYGSLRQSKERYTVTDYFHFPQDRGRCELIDGAIYDMASPTAAHQSMSLRLAALFLHHVDENGGGCRIYTAPFDVVPDPADKHTVVQPDVMVICDPSKIRRGFCEGAPDLIVEILSPSTRRRDLFVKHGKYAAAGVREYWIVDIDAQTVVVYDFEHASLPAICGFSTPVPVGIWEGRCIVDFSDIFAKI